jgi:membrane protein implicated in regulation of membrane protease activity
VASLFANPWYWIIAGTLIAGLEILVPGVFLLWIGLGALLVGLLLSAFPDLSLTLQLLVFAFGMVGSIGAGYFVQRHSRSGQDLAPLNHELDGLVGLTLFAASDFELGRGRVRVGDTTYSAVSDDPLGAESAVRVVGIEDGRLRVIAHTPERHV